MHISTAVDAAERELLRACTKHSRPLKSGHEGYAVILEELDELWDEVKAQTVDPAKLRTEAIHTAAMALRFLVDLCEEEKTDA